jgi:uncharacterized membrane protein YfcA
MEIAGYFASLLIGISLGLIGGGGSILTVPVLVYLFSIQPVMATAYSLFIVGLTSLVGTYSYAKRNLISYKAALIFGLPSIVAVYATRKFIVPAIPDVLFQLGSFQFTKPIALMTLFAVLMVFASYSMIKKSKNSSEEDDYQEQKFNIPLILVEGIIVGILTGLVGAGGGFLIIPALVVLSKLPMKQAVGTSLLIIAAKSLFGFLGDLSNLSIDWNFLLIVSAIAASGIFIGTFLSSKIDGAKLKTAFGWFVLAMGIYIIIKELFLN